MNVVTVKVNGIEYNLKGDEKEEYLHKVASYVDKKLNSITEANATLSTTSAAILTAINTTDEMFKQEGKCTALEEESKKYDEFQNLEDECERLKNELKNLKEENGKLAAENKELKFNLKTAKYKLIDLQSKILDDQIDIAKAKMHKKF